MLKPLHGWREFLSEVAIIVVGVLIALAADQVVEDLHWRSETRAAREALLSEARDNLASAQFRKSLHPCVERRLSELAEVFRTQAAGRPIKLEGPVRRPLPLGATRSTWDVAVSSGALSHMRLAEKLTFGDAFTNYEYWDHIQNREQEAWLTLGLLDDPTILTENDWANLHQAYAQARSLDARIQIIASGLLANSTLGQRPSQVHLPPAAQATVKEFCTPIASANRTRL